jgi:small subunit ribosomal protein S2
MMSIDKLAKDPSWDNLSKREKLQIGRQRAKLEKILGSISDLTRLPAALFIVDVMKEKIAVREAHRLGIPVFAIVDTNSNPEGIDFVIPANDDASQSIKLIVGAMVDAVREGLNERKAEKKDDEEVPRKKSRRKIRKDKVTEPEPVENEKVEDNEDVVDDEDSGDEEE